MLPVSKRLFLKLFRKWLTKVKAVNKPAYKNERFT